MDSAIGYALDVIDRLRVTGRSLPGRAFLVQTLGAPNGYLAAAVAAAAGIEEVLVPERPYDLDDLGRRLRDGAVAGTGIAVMSEAVGDAVGVAAELAARAGIRVHPTHPRARPACRDAVATRSRGRATPPVVRPSTRSRRPGRSWSRSRRAAPSPRSRWLRPPNRRALVSPR